MFRNRRRSVQQTAECLTLGLTFSRNIDKATRENLLKQGELWCNMCGSTRRDPDPYHSWRKVRLHVGLVNPNGLVVEDNLQILCNACREGRKELTVLPPANLQKIIWELWQLSLNEQMKIFELLEPQFST